MKRNVQSLDNDPMNRSRLHGKSEGHKQRVLNWQDGTTSGMIMKLTSIQIPVRPRQPYAEGLNLRLEDKQESCPKKDSFSQTVALVQKYQKQQNHRRGSENKEEVVMMLRNIGGKVSVVRCRRVGLIYRTLRFSYSLHCASLHKATLKIVLPCLSLESEGISKL